jgi:hypothetical protein
MFVANPRVKTPMDLKGKSLGVNSLSGGGWIFAMLMLDYWGLVPERDKIQFRSLGEQAVMAQGVMSGTVDAAFLGYTFGKILEGKGFTVLADSEKLPIPYQGSGLISKKSFVSGSSAAVENVLRALLDSSKFIRNPENKSLVMKSLAKALRFRRVEDAEDGYRSMVNLYEKKIYPSVDGIRNVIRLLGTTNEKIRRLKAEELVDDSAVRKMEKEGRFLAIPVRAKSASLPRTDQLPFKARLAACGQRQYRAAALRKTAARTTENPAAWRGTASG